MEEFLLEANTFHPTVKCTAETSNYCLGHESVLKVTDSIRNLQPNHQAIHLASIHFLESILDVRTHFKHTETFQYMKEGRNMKSYFSS